MSDQLNRQAQEILADIANAEHCNTAPNNPKEYYDTAEGAWHRVARPSTGPEKRSAPRAGQRLGGVVASR